MRNTDPTEPNNPTRQDTHKMKTKEHEVTTLAKAIKADSEWQGDPELLARFNQSQNDGLGWKNYPDEVRIKKIARGLSLEFRRKIVETATALNVPTIKYKWQWLLEEVIADMEAFV